jgi:hypothetical protein
LPADLQLLEVPGAGGSLPHEFRLAQGRQQQRRQDRDDGNNYQELYESECRSMAVLVPSSREVDCGTSSHATHINISNAAVWVGVTDGNRVLAYGNFFNTLATAMLTRIVLLVLAVLGSLPAPGQTPRLMNVKDQQAAEETVAGKRTTANAAWWGFNREDSTEALQAAINSGAKTLIVPFMGDPWIVRPLQLRSQQEIILEPGVLILAKKGEFQGGGDSLFSAVGQSNLVIHGYGATLRMHKRDYQNPPYTKAE